MDAERTTSPSTAFVLLSATTTILDLVCDTMLLTLMPASVTPVSLSAPDSSSTPTMVTLVLSCPCDGVTEWMSLLVTYSNPSFSTTVAPSTEVSVTSTLRPSELSVAPALTTTVVSLSDWILATNVPNATETMFFAPDRRLDPLMVTTAPAAPLAGTTFSMLPSSAYVHCLALDTTAPLSAVSTTSPAAPAACLPATTCTRKLLSRMMVAALPDRVTLTTLLAWARRSSP